MSNYSLDTPINRKLYEFTERDVPFAPAYQPKPPSETDQSHRNMTWLQHKPRELAKVFIATESGRHKKK
jgi:hypothetical protein